MHSVVKGVGAAEKDFFTPAGFNVVVSACFDDLDVCSCGVVAGLGISMLKGSIFIGGKGGARIGGGGGAARLPGKVY